MSAPAAAVVVFVAIVAVVVVVMAVLVLLRRVAALKDGVQHLSASLDPALQDLRRGAEVTRTELSSLQRAARQRADGT